MPPGVVIAGVFSCEEKEDQPPGVEDEYVVLVNTSDQLYDIRGWSLTNLKQDKVDHYRYLFPRFLSNGDPWVLEPGGMVLVYTGRGTNGCTATLGESHQYHLYQHRPLRIWTEPGDTACLYDRTGKLISCCSLRLARRTA